MFEFDETGVRRISKAVQRVEREAPGMGTPRQNDGGGPGRAFYVAKTQGDHAKGARADVDVCYVDANGALQDAGFTVKATNRIADLKGVQTIYIADFSGVGEFDIIVGDSCL